MPYPEAQSLRTLLDLQGWDVALRTSLYVGRDLPRLPTDARVAAGLTALASRVEGIYTQESPADRFCAAGIGRVSLAASTAASASDTFRYRWALAHGAIVGPIARGAVDPGIPVASFTALGMPRAWERATPRAKGIVSEVLGELMAGSSRDKVASMPGRGLPWLKHVFTRCEELLGGGSLAGWEFRACVLGITAVDSTALIKTAAADECEWQTISARRLAVALLAATGLSNSRIATQLYVSKHDVNSHMKRVMRELEVHNRSNILPALIRRGNVVIGKPSVARAL